LGDSNSKENGGKWGEILKNAGKYGGLKMLQGIFMVIEWW
jgi:hypothetical protein